jgi:signal peptidase I
MNGRWRQITVSPWWARLVIGRRPWVTLIRLLVLVAVSLVLFRGVFVPIRVVGSSMEPSYRDGRINFLGRWAYRSTSPRRGDVVGIRKVGSKVVVLKRIVGMPGERVTVRGGRVLVNGLPLAEPYAQGQGIPSTRLPLSLGPEEYFAIGDNREVTLYGVVNRSEIMGKVLF